MDPPHHSVTAWEEFRRGWKIVLVSAVGLAFGLSALRIYSIGVLTKPLTAAFGISRGDVQSIYTFMTVGNLLASPFLGVLIDRHGVRRLTLISIVLMAVGMAMMGLAHSLWELYIIGFFMSVLGVGTVPITWTRVIVDWFSVGRGLALGIALSGTGVVAIFLPLYTTWLVSDFGWRAAYVGIGALPLVFALPMSYWLLYDRTGATASRPIMASTANNESEFRDVLKDYRFWVMAVAFFLVGACVAGLIATLVPILTDRGLTAGTAARIAGVIGIMVIIGRSGTGLLLDRFWAPGVALLLFSAPVCGCLILVSRIGGLSGEIAAAATIGLATGAEFSLMAFMVSKYFGQRHYGIIYACLYAVWKLSAGLGAPMFGYSFDITKSYNSILYFSAGAIFVGSTLLLTLGPYGVSAPEIHPGNAPGRSIGRRHPTATITSRDI
jgi:MFS family permease